MELIKLYMHPRCLKSDIRNTCISAWTSAGRFLLSSCLPKFKWWSHLHSYIAQKSPNFSSSQKVSAELPEAQRTGQVTISFGAATFSFKSGKATPQHSTPQIKQWETHRTYQPSKMNLIVLCWICCHVIVFT